MKKNEKKTKETPQKIKKRINAVKTAAGVRSTEKSKPIVNRKSTKRSSSQKNLASSAYKKNLNRLKKEISRGKSKQSWLESFDESNLMAFAVYSTGSCTQDSFTPSACCNTCTFGCIATVVCN